MISRTLLSALVGLSLAAGTFGAASAQTTEPATVAPATQMVSPGDATVPAAAAKVDTSKTDTGKTKPIAAKARHTRMKAKAHHRHLTQRIGRHVKTAGHSSAKRIRLSRLVKHGAGKHV